MEAMQRLTGLGMDELVRKYVTGPLGMADTFYKPALADRKRYYGGGGLWRLGGWLSGA